MELYNRASGLAAAVSELWRRESGRDDLHLAAALASSPDAAARLRETVEKSAHEQLEPAALAARLEHFITENEEILPAAGDALEQEDLEAFGRLVDRSQQAAERLLGNQIPQTVHLAAAARQHGAVAASAFGAGFGGSVWAMVPKAEAGEFLEAWADSYAREFPENTPQAKFFVAGAGPAAFQIC
jgi:galactokinase